MKKFSKILIIMTLLALIISACAPVATPTAAPAEPAGPTKSETTKVALVLPGVISDAGWNASAYEGVMEAKKALGVEVAYSEAVAMPDFEATFRDYASKGYTVVIGHGSEFGDAALTVAKEFPETYFAITNADVKAPNVAGLDTKNEESGYMAGYVAGTISKTKKVGYVGAIEIVAMRRAEEGYKLGVKASCPDCEVLVGYTGSFDDIAKGKETALAQIEKGADVLFQYADGSGLGVIEAAKDKDIAAIGMTGDQSPLAPDNVVTSTLQALGPIIISIVKEVQEGKFVPNTVHLYGYDTGAYDLAPLNKRWVTDEQAAKIAAVVADMKAGKIKLPHLTEQKAEEPAAPATPVKVALVLPGVISDAGWNASAYEGVMAAKEELGVEVAYSEAVAMPDFEATFRDYASKGYNLVVGHGSEFGDAALTVAKEFPDTYFAITNADVKAPNVAGLDTKNEESGYMAGYVAGTITKTKKVGYVGAMEIVAMKRGEEGFKAGVKAACPDCEVLVGYTGSFDDIAKGKETALAQIEKGADVLFQYADGSGLGVIEAAKDKDLAVIGMTADQSPLAPDHVVTSTLQALGPIIVSIVKEVQDGKFVPNEVRLYGYDTGAYDLASLNKKWVTDEQAAKIEAVLADMKAGKIDLPHLSGQ